MKKENGIILLCSDGDSSRAVYNALKEKFGEFPVIMEKPMSRLGMAKKRVKKIGYAKVVGQFFFVSAIVPFLYRASRRRIAEIEREFNLQKDWGEANIFRVDSVNSEAAREILTNVQPKAVVVSGTRIIGKKTLECVAATFINIHAGITPLYRGVHGAYWALAEEKRDLVGTTIHLVDQGIDTGNVIEQAFFEVTEKDNFTTYPFLHTAHGIPILLEAVEKCLNDNLAAKNKPNHLPSKLRYHPAIWEYIYHRLKKSVK